MEHCDFFPASILKIICTIVMVVCLVGTFGMFYEDLDFAFARLKKTTRPTRSCKESFVWICCVCCHDDKQSTPSAGHTFRSCRIVWRGSTSLLSNSASRSGPRLPDAPFAEQVLLPQGRRLVFSRTGKRGTKKGNKKQRKEKHFVQTGL